MTRGVGPRSTFVLAPFGISNHGQLNALADALEVPPRSMVIVIRSGRPSLAATEAGARVVTLELGTTPRQLLPSAARLLEVFRLARHARPNVPCVWVDRGWIGPYELVVGFALWVVGARGWRLVHADGSVEYRTSRRLLRALVKAVADNARAVRDVTGAADRLGSLRVPERTARPPTHALYMRLDLPLAVSPEPGGSLSHSEGIIGGLQDAGLSVSTVAPIPIAAPGRPTPTHVAVDFRPPTNLHPELAEAQFNRHVARQLETLDLGGVDVVYERYALFGSAGLELAHRLGVPFVLEANASEVRFRRQYDSILFARAAERFEKALFEAASLVVAVSQRVVDDIREIAPRARVLLVPNGVDPTLFTVTDDARRETRKRLGFDDDEVVVGFVGRFYTWHGVETLAEAADEFLAQSPAIRLLLVGDGDLRETLERSLSPWRERVRFTGIVGHSEVPALIAACDIVVSPHAPMEGFIGSPMKVFEYLASGRAVVASRLEQIAEVIDDGNTGLLVEPGDAGALAAAVVKLAQSPDLRQRLGAAARADALRSHAWPAKVRTILAHLKPADVAPQRAQDVARCR